MKTNVVEKSEWERELEVAVPAARVEDELNKAYRKYQKRLEVPGFRKGKAPLRIIKARFGESIRGEVIADLMPAFLAEAARQTGLIPVNSPTISQLKDEPGQELTFTAMFEVLPEIGEVHYEGLEATRMVHEVTEDEVDEQLRNLQDRQATERSVDRPLQSGDVLVADLQRLDDQGLPIIGDKHEERRLSIGRGESISAPFEDALIGIAAEEERDVRFTYPDDLPNKQLAGTEARFRVSAREVRERELPSLDDDFAKDLGAPFENLEALRQDLRGQIEAYWQRTSRQRLRSELISRLMARNPFPLPERLVEHYIDSIHQRRNEELPSAQPHEHSDEERRYAEHSLRRHLLFAGIRKQADLQASDQEFDAFLTQYAGEVGVDVETLKASSEEQLDELRRDFEDKQVLDLLLQHATITEEKA